MATAFISGHHVKRGNVFISQDNNVNVPSRAQVIVPGAVHLVKGWLEPARADEFGRAIVDETFHRWVGQLKYGKSGRFFDRGHTMSRFGDPGVTYSFKGKPKPMYEMTPSLVALKELVSETLAWAPNCVVINSYAPGSGLYPHRDGQYIPQLGINPVIAAVSFGATRTFLLHRWDPVVGKRLPDPVALSLGHGDLVVMHGTCDTDYQHSIPEEPHVVGTRVSLTFRRHLS